MDESRYVSDEIELKNGKGNPFGFSRHQIWHNNKCIGQQYCGKITLSHPRYTHKIVDEGNGVMRVTVFLLPPKDEEEENMDRLENLIK